MEIGPTGYPSYYSGLVDMPSLEWHTLDIGEKYIGKGHANPLRAVIAYRCLINCSGAFLSLLTIFALVRNSMPAGTYRND